MSKNKAKRKANRRRKLWQENPNCRECGCLTILPEDLLAMHGKITCPDNMATIEHERSRLNPSRWEPNGDNTERTTLLCRKCNGGRSQKEQEALGRERLDILSRWYHGKTAREMIELRVLVLGSILTD